jgi:hypothetical protein
VDYDHFGALKIDICNQKLHRMKKWLEGKKCALQRQHRNLLKYMTSLFSGVNSILYLPVYRMYFLHYLCNNMGKRKIPFFY